MPSANFGFTAALAAAAIVVGASIASAVVIPTVTIGNPGNAPDPTTGFGSVAYTYNIATTEVTNAQYAEFLNCVAATDTHNLYNGNGTSTAMAGPFGGITRSGSAGSYTYATVSGRANHPVIFVSFWDACRFANWLHNGQPTGAQSNATTEDGAYTLTADGINANTIARNADWQWAVTSEDEWYKAAYHQPATQGGDSDNYWRYPTSSNAVPTTAQANFSASGINNTTPVGSYAANFYATFDMGGNVWEWNEAIIASSDRGIRGGSHYDNGYLLASARGYARPSIEDYTVGIRVSQVAQATQCPACPADFDQDGGVTGADVAAFFTDYETGAACADVDINGGVDGGDVGAFFVLFEAGGC